MFLPTLTAFRFRFRPFSVCNWPISLNHSLCSCQGAVRSAFPFPFSGSGPSSFPIRFSFRSGFSVSRNPENDTDLSSAFNQQLPFDAVRPCQPALWHLTRFLEAFAIFGMASLNERSAFPLLSRIDLGMSFRISASAFSLERR